MIKIKKMLNMRLYLTAFILLLLPTLLIGCSDIPGKNEGGRLSKNQVMKMNPDADIFEFEERVYKAGIDWVEEEQLTKDQQIGDISEGMANTLPIGAKIYSAKEYPDKDILIVEYDGKEKNYLFQAGE